jgi:hypothetical protein
MHRQLNALVSAGGSPGKLAAFGKALGKEGLDIQTIGGAEWKHDGPLCLIIKNDGREDLDKFAKVCGRLKVPWMSFASVEVELDDVPGSLGDVAEVVGEINIYCVLVLKSHGNRAVVGLGFKPSEADEAVRLLRAADYTADRKHHPDEPDDGGVWDERTENLLPLWDDDSVARDDSRFYS